MGAMKDEAIKERNEGFIDLTPISFEYAYHLHFKHP